MIFELFWQLYEKFVNVFLQILKISLDVFPNKLLISKT